MVGLKDGHSVAPMAVMMEELKAERKAASLAVCSVAHWVVQSAGVMAAAKAVL